MTKKGNILTLRLSIYSDDPVGQEGADEKNIFSKPDTLLWEKVVREGEFKETLYSETKEKGEYFWDLINKRLTPDADKQIWQVDIKIKPEEAFAQKGTNDRPMVYWLLVSAKIDEGEFGWKTRSWPYHFNDDAVFIVSDETYELRYPSGHPHAHVMFEDLTIGKEYFVGDMFTTSGVDVYVTEFTWSNNIITTSGRATVLNGSMSGGSGNEINTNNVNLLFDFPTLYNPDLRFGEYGGNVNLAINGDFRNASDFYALNGTIIGGVEVTVLPDPTSTTPEKGYLHLDGVINSFQIGGQELWIDNVGSSSIDMAFALTHKIIGDVNEDNVIDIVDALLIALSYVELIPAYPVDIADVNCDGYVDIVDALLVAQYYVGLLSSLGC